MKKTLFVIWGVLCVMAIQAQPRPFEPDPSFVPSLDFLQKTWSGEYDGLEPNSRMILSLRRTLVLKTDLTYTNEVMGHVKNQSEEVLLRYETGTYQYRADAHAVAYSIEVDSTLDINILLKGEELVYAVNHYLEDGNKKTSTEGVQFTRAASDDARQWIMFDQQLMSPIDSRQKAVYVLQGTASVISDISNVVSEMHRSGKSIYDMNGRKLNNANGGIVISNGKKSFYMKRR